MPWTSLALVVAWDPAGSTEYMPLTVAIHIRCGPSASSPYTAGIFSCFQSGLRIDPGETARHASQPDPSVRAYSSEPARET